MSGKVLLVGLCDLRFASNHQQVLRVAVLRLPREVERAGDDGAAVDDDHLVVCDRVLSVGPDGDVVVRQVRAAAELLTGRLPVEDRPDGDAAILSLGQRPGDLGAGEAVRLHVDTRLGPGDLFHDRLRATAPWAEIYCDSVVGGRGHGRLAPLFGSEQNAGRKNNATARDRQEVSHAAHDAFEMVAIKREACRTSLEVT